MSSSNRSVKADHNTNGAEIPHIHRDNTVSEQLYQTIMARCQALRENDFYKQLFRYIHFEDGYNAWDKHTGHKKLPSRLVATLEGPQALRDWENGRYNADQALKRYKRDVSPGFKYSGYSAEKGLCRIILDPGTDDLIDRWLGENEEKRRYFMTGKAYNINSQYKRHQAMLKRHEQLEGDEELYDSQVRIMRYMNNLPYMPFRRMVDEHYWDAVRVSHERSVPELHRVRLKNINDFPKPFYSPRPHNARLYAPGSLQGLHKDVRRAIAPHWIDLDLTSSLGAIAARIWDIEGLYDLLASGDSLWEVLIEQLGMQDWPYKAVKDIIKDMFCATFYHMSKRGLNRQYTEQCEKAGLEPADGLKFTDAPLIAEVLRARARIQRAIKKDGGCDGAYGFMELPNTLELPSFLAHVIQSYELAILDAAFEVAERRTDFQIMVYSFDGVSIAIEDGCEQNVIQHLQRAVNERAREFGIPTRLVVDNE